MTEKIISSWTVIAMTENNSSEAHNLYLKSLTGRCQYYKIKKIIHAGAHDVNYLPFGVPNNPCNKLILN
jgi:hypothetical protein